MWLLAAARRSRLKGYLKRVEALQYNCAQMFLQELERLAGRKGGQYKAHDLLHESIFEDMVASKNIRFRIDKVCELSPMQLCSVARMMSQPSSPGSPFPHRLQECKKKTDLPPRLFVAAQIASGATSRFFEVMRPFIM